MTSDRLERRNARAVATTAGFGFAALASAALWFVPPHTSGNRIDLESLLPFVGNSVSDTLTGPQSGGSVHSGLAGLILIAVAVVAGLPLLVRPAHRWRLLVWSAAVVSLFALATILRNGLFFVPSAALLCWAAWGTREHPVVNR